MLGGLGAELCLGDPADPECSCQELGAPLETPHGALRVILLLLALQLPSLSLSLLPPPPCHPLAQLQGHREEQPDRFSQIALCLIFLSLIVLGFFSPSALPRGLRLKTVSSQCRGALRCSAGEQRPPLGWSLFP